MITNWPSISLNNTSRLVKGDGSTFLSIIKPNRPLKREKKKRSCEDCWE